MLPEIPLNLLALIADVVLKYPAYNHLCKIIRIENNCVFDIKCFTKVVELGLNKCNTTE
jgi:hypothetical protein